MDTKRQAELVKKYWEGESTPAEERRLIDSDLNGLDERERIHFEQLKAFSKLSLDADFEIALMDKITTERKPINIQRWMPSIGWKIAAVFLLGLSFYYLYTPIITSMEDQKTEIALEEDPERAFELTKQALLLVSAKLNKASKVDVGLEKFETAINKIEKENAL